MKEAIDVAAAWLTNDAGEVLICRRAPSETRAGYWEFPGGKFEAGESGEEALVRELQEELDMEVSCGALLETMEHAYSNGRFRIHLFACRAIVNTVPSLRVHDQIAWVKPEDILNYKVLEGDIPLIKSYLAKQTGLL